MRSPGHLAPVPAHVPARSVGATDSTLARAPEEAVHDLLLHVTAALSAHLRQRRSEGRTVPPAFAELTTLLVECVRTRQEATGLYAAPFAANDAPVAPRLLLTKGETAARLGVSVRTVERLVAAGRLPLLRVEGSCRLRVDDVVAYVDALTPDCGGTARTGTGTVTRTAQRRT